ncbi:MAG: GNAT family N-acetyltransferase [Desulfobacterales bacterium]|nr:GNAT family N-acetyltransferase [Desulfobacterales bacterium]
MKIEQLTEKYIDQLVYVVDEYRKFCGFAPSQKNTKEFFLNLLRTNQSITFIAVSNENEVMGFINLYPSYSTLALKRILILNDLGVSNHFRRLGVAQALIKHVLEYARSSGAIRVELKTEKTNKNAQQLYADIGFQIDDENIYYRVPVG